MSSTVSVGLKKYEPLDTRDLVPFEDYDELSTFWTLKIIFLKPSLRAFKFSSKLQLPVHNFLYTMQIYNFTNFRLFLCLAILFVMMITYFHAGANCSSIFYGAQ